MGKVTRGALEAKIGQLFGKNAPDATLTLTLKRKLNLEGIVLKNSAISQAKLAALQKHTEDGTGDLKHPVVAKLKFQNGKKLSADINSNDVAEFAYSISSLMKPTILKGISRDGITKTKVPTVKNSYSKTTRKVIDRKNFIKKLSTRRKEFRSKRRRMKEYLWKLAKGLLEKGDKCPE